MKVILSQKILKDIFSNKWQVFLSGILLYPSLNSNSIPLMQKQKKKKRIPLPHPDSFLSNWSLEPSMKYSSQKPHCKKD
jgi:hypothetical protein